MSNKMPALCIMVQRSNNKYIVFLLFIG